MGFFEDVYKVGSFSGVSNNSLSRAKDNFDMYLYRIVSPYYDLTSNVQAMGHLFYHATQLLRDLGRFIYGTGVLIGALLTGHWSNAGKVAYCMLELVGAAILEILNIALAVISLVTRLLVSILNFGYVSTRHELQSIYFNTDKVSSFIESKHDGIYTKLLENIEHQNAFRLV